MNEIYENNEYGLMISLVNFHKKLKLQKNNKKTFGVIPQPRTNIFITTTTSPIKRRSKVKDRQHRLGPNYFHKIKNTFLMIFFNLSLSVYILFETFSTACLFFPVLSMI